MSRVFLSHSHPDKPFVRRLAADLRNAGHDVWIDEAEIRIGDSLIGKIREGIDQVDYVAAVLSSASIASEWVTRELDIASNREIEEKRVVVLPLLIERVALPGFLKGKLYGDFTDDSRYGEAFAKLLSSLGEARKMPAIEASELEGLREQLRIAQEHVARQDAALQAHQRAAMRKKSPKLIAAVEKENEHSPTYAPVNASYAFEALDTPITLGYLLWGISKAQREGAHVLDVVLSLDNKWDEAVAMLDAYSDMLDARASLSKPG